MKGSHPAMESKLTSLLTVLSLVITTVVAVYLFIGAGYALERRMPLLLAALGVGLFGMCHGYAHGYEIPSIESTWVYALGFLITTACLHLIGAVGGILILERPHGGQWLRCAGTLTTTIGCYLLMR